MGTINRIISKALIFLIRAYRYFISPWLGAHCRFEPSCGQYAIVAIQELGIIKGCYKTFTRLLRCHPFAKGGYDPVVK